MTDKDKIFAGSIPALYDRYLGPLIFEPYALDLAERLSERTPQRILEIAAGTGIVSRAMARRLPGDCAILATDLNQPMLDHAVSQTKAMNVTFGQADAQALPFDDGVFDAVVCQFGVMFFPDKAAAFAAAGRVLKPGGRYLFNVWDRIEANDFAHMTVETLAKTYPQNPPRFLARTPTGFTTKPSSSDCCARRGFRGSRSRRLPKRAGRPRPLSRPSDFARAARCAARSRPWAPASWRERPRPSPPPLPPASVKGRSRARSRRS